MLYVFPGGAEIWQMNWMGCQVGWSLEVKRGAAHLSWECKWDGHTRQTLLCPLVLVQNLSSWLFIQTGKGHRFEREERLHVTVGWLVEKKAAWYTESDRLTGWGAMASSSRTKIGGWGLRVGGGVNKWLLIIHRCKWEWLSVTICQSCDRLRAPCLAPVLERPLRGKAVRIMDGSQSYYCSLADRRSTYWKMFCFCHLSCLYREFTPLCSSVITR